jgi:hypothetical protein
MPYKIILTKSQLDFLYKYGFKSDFSDYMVKEFTYRDNITIRALRAKGFLEIDKSFSNKYQDWVYRWTDFARNWQFGESRLYLPPTSINRALGQLARLEKLKHKRLQKEQLEDNFGVKVKLQKKPKRRRTPSSDPVRHQQRLAYWHNYDATHREKKLLHHKRSREKNAIRSKLRAMGIDLPLDTESLIELGKKFGLAVTTLDN